MVISITSGRNNRTIGDRNYIDHYRIGHLLWPITGQLIRPITSRLLWPIKIIKNSAPKCNQENGIRIFDPMLFEDTVVSKIMEDFYKMLCYE